MQQPEEDTAFSFPPNNNTTTLLPRSIPLVTLLPRLDALLMVLKSCKGRTCTHPWSVVHPAGDVTSLGEALREEFDDFYQTQQNKVVFDKCEKGYFPESEGPMSVRPFVDTARGREAIRGMEFEVAL